jgi:hypothetical protein
MLIVRYYSILLICYKYAITIQKKLNFTVR